VKYCVNVLVIVCSKVGISIYVFNELINDEILGNFGASKGLYKIMKYNLNIDTILHLF